MLRGGGQSACGAGGRRLDSVSPFYLVAIDF